MAKQLNVDLRINADTSQAKIQLQNLQQSLTQLTTGIANQGANLGITPQIQQAEQAAIKLKAALSQSMNVDTGKFDLSKFNSSLKSMNMDLEKLKTQLTSIGPQGQQTFMALAQSIMTAEIPTKRISSSLAQLGVTLKNTAKWQLSSSMLHGFMSAVQTSYRYAQDLNESLNNIRIVTGESTEAMDMFVAKANKAAKALSSSTLDYTNAALIYYQQGLNNKEVEERTAVTLKMANVSRQSAEIVSDQMTAVWNNFYDGSKSLEYYADVMTALGAATASSSDEIAGGLEKFAAIGETIGLSYEYAAAALATITSNTRQSEEVVGTALKTIFARIQGLNLGETLEDGVNLNKYSEALQTVGISIFEQNGELKKMDNILNEMGNKWDTLSKSQQTALAQTVAGVRQYNQLISLMENWNKNDSDSMVANLNTAYNSTGALEEQADIYAESWEGASKRVKAAAEEVYMDLLDDDFFIDLTNGLADFLGLLDNLLDSMGGAKGLLTGLSSILLNMFAGSAAKGLENMVYNFKSFVGLTQQEAMATQTKTLNLTQGMSIDGSESAVAQAQGIALQENLSLTHTLAQVKKDLSEQDQLIAQKIIAQNQAYQEQLITLGQIKDTAITEYNMARINFNDDLIGLNMQDPGIDPNWVMNQIDTDLQIVDDLAKIDMALDKGQMNLEEYIKQLQILQQTAQSRELFGLANELNNNLIDGDGNLLSDSTLRSRAKMRSQSDGGYDRMNAYTRFDLLNKNEDNTLDPRHFEDYIRSSQRAQEASRKFEQGQKNLQNTTKDAANQIKNLNKSYVSWSQTVVGVAQSAMSLSFAINSIKSLGTTWADDNIGVGEKLLQTFMSLGMAIPMLTNGWNGMGKALGGMVNLSKEYQKQQLIANSLSKINLATGQAELTLTKQKITSLTAEQIVEKTGLSLDEAKNALGQARLQQMMLNHAANNTELNLMAKTQIAKKLNITTEQVDIMMKKLAIGATWKQAAAEGGLGVSLKVAWVRLKAQAAAMWENVVALWAMLGPILAIIAALAALALAVKFCVDAYNADAKAAEKAANAAKLAAQEFENAQQAYEDFKNSMTGYDEAVSGLNKLTKGTIEYKEQLMKANEEAMKLIRAQDMVYGRDYTYGEDGLIEFTKDASGKSSLEIAREQQFNDLQRMEANKNFTTTRAKEAQTKADLTEYNRKELGSGVDWVSAGGEAAAFAAAGAGIGALVGSFVPILGNIVGAGVGAAVGAIVGLGAGITEAVMTWGASTDEEEKAMKLLAEQYNKIGDAVLADKDGSGIQQTLEGLVDQSVIDRIIKANADDSDKLREMLSSINETTAAIKGQIEQSAGAANQDNQAYNQLLDEDKSIADKIIAERASKILADKDSKEYKQAQKNAAKAIMEESGKTKFFQGDDQDTYDKYMEITYGKNWADNYRVTNQVGNKAATIEKKNEDGGWEVVGDKRNTLTNKEVIDALTTWYVQQYGDSDQKTLNNLNKVEEIINKNVKGIDEDAIFDIQSALAEGSAVDLTLMTPEQVQALQNQMGEINNTFSDYGKAIQAGIDAYSEEAYKARMEAEADSIIEAGAQELETTTGALEAYTNVLMTNNEELAKNKKLAAETAVETFRFSKQLDKLEGVVKDNIKNIKNFNKNNLECYESLGAVQEALKETFGTKVSSDFVLAAGNMDLIAKAAEGDQKAVKELGMALSKDFVENLEYSTTLIDEFYSKDFAEENGLQIGDRVFNSLDEFNNYFANTKSVVLGYIDEISNASLGIGDNIANALGEDDVANFVASLNEMAIMTQMSVESMQSMLANMGIQAKVKSTFIKQPVEVPKYRTETQIIKLGNPLWGNDGRIVETKTWQEGADIIEDGGISVASISYDGNDPTAPAITYTGERSALTTPTSSGSSKNGGSSGGSSSKPKKTEKKDPEIDRFHEIKEALEDLENEYSHIGELKDATFGADKLAYYDQEIAKLEEITAAEANYTKELEKQVSIDKGKAESIGAIFDANGRITNYNDLITAATDEWNKTSSELDTKENAGQDIEELRKQNDEKLEQTKEFLDTYEDTLNEWEDTKFKETQRKLEKQRLQYEKLEYKLNLKLEINEVEQKNIDYYMSKIEDDFYKRAEVMAFQKDTAKNAQEDLENYKSFKDALDQKIAEGKITQEDYVNGLKEVQDGMIDNMQEIEEINEAMGEYYLDTLNEAMDKIDTMTSKFDNFKNTLQHMKDSLSLLGKGQDYRWLNTIIDAESEVVADQLQAAKDTKEWLESELSDKKLELKLLDPNSVNYQKDKENLENEINDIEDKINTTTDNIWEYATTQAELAQEKLTNQLETLRQELEDTWTSGKGFDVLQMQLETLQSYDEKYLNTTNKMYETNKMLLNIDKDIANTNNTAAKQQLSDFANYVKEKQESNKLSKFDLSIMQAEYELLQAKIALEEAQNAKSQVRLQRDAEGNFGYVYTADDSAIADAEMNYLDKQNALYNLGREQQMQQYNEMLQITKEYNEALSELWTSYYVEQTISEEEFLNQKQALEDQFRVEYEAAQEIFNSAQLVMSQNSYSELSQKDEEYYGGLRLQGVNTEESLRKTMVTMFGTDLTEMERNVEMAFHQAEKYGKEYRISTDELRELVGKNFAEMRDRVNDVTDASEILSDYLAEGGEFRTNLDKVLENVKNQKLAWNSWYTNINTNVIPAYEKLNGQIAETIRLMSEQQSTEVSQNSNNNNNGGNITSTSYTKNSSNNTENNNTENNNNLINKQLQNQPIKKTAPLPQPTEFGQAQELMASKSSNAILQWNGNDWVLTQGTKKNSHTEAKLLIKNQNGTVYNPYSNSFKRNTEYSYDWYNVVRKATSPGPNGKVDLTSYDTGGYTGNWGPEGRIAMLHQKELVLNASDTENILASVAMIREISQALDIAATAQSFGMANLQAGNIGTLADQILQQEVHIDAQFPNVTDHNEIELAIDNLINAASQYAGR